MNEENKSTKTVQEPRTQNNPKPEEMYLKLSIDANASKENSNVIEAHVTADISCDKEFAINAILGVMEEHSSLCHIIMGAAAQHASKGVKKIFAELDKDIKDIVDEIKKSRTEATEQPAEPNV